MIAMLLAAVLSAWSLPCWPADGKATACPSGKPVTADDWNQEIAGMSEWAARTAGAFHRIDERLAEPDAEAAKLDSESKGEIDRSARKWSSPVPFDPRVHGMMCVESDPPRARARVDQLLREDKLHLFWPLRFSPSCTRCLARGKDGKPVEVDPLVCDAAGVGPHEVRP